MAVCINSQYSRQHLQWLLQNCLCSCLGTSHGTFGPICYELGRVPRSPESETWSCVSHWSTSLFWECNKRADVCSGQYTKVLLQYDLWSSTTWSQLKTGKFKSKINSSSTSACAVKAGWLNTILNLLKNKFVLKSGSVTKKPKPKDAQKLISNSWLRRFLGLWSSSLLEPWNLFSFR